MPLPRLFERKTKPEVVTHVRTIHSAQEKQVNAAVEAGLYPARIASRNGAKLMRFALYTFVTTVLVIVVLSVTGLIEPIKTLLQPVSGDTGGLIVSTDFVKVHVKIDGKELGISPYNGQGIAAGQHVLRIETVDNLNGFWAPTEIPIIITRGNTTVVTINPAPSESMVNYTIVTSQQRRSKDDAKLIIKTIPSDAQIAVDDVSQGAAPLVTSAIASGTHKIAIAAGGYKQTSVEVSLSDDKTVTVEVRLYKFQVTINAK